MGFFHLHRTSSSSSSRSASSTYSSATSYTPRTSTDSADDYMSATLKPQSTPPRAPLLDLPFEILQHVASYLDDASASVFSLSSRQLCYALGTQRLSNYISSSPSRFDARERLEETIERAFPGAWHCAWCSKFHLWSSSDAPSSLERGVQLPCAEYNSYLTDGTGYTLQYAHIRLALAHARFGPSHGLPLSSFSHSRSGSIKLFRTPMQTSISHNAKITQARFLLHTNYSILLPTWAAQHKNLIGHLWPLLPPLLTQHRASEYGHSGLMAALDNVVRRGWRVVGAQSCSDCSTDWSVSAYTVPRSVAGEFVRVNVRIWRDLGSGASPFESGWRAHGPYIPGTEDSCVREEMRRERGSVRDAFEDSAWVGEERGERGMCGVESEWETLAYSWQIEKKKEDERDQEREWRAIWKYIERRAGVEARKA